MLRRKVHHYVVYALLLLQGVVLSACSGHSTRQDFDYSGSLVEERVEDEEGVRVRVRSGSIWGKQAKLRIRSVIGDDDTEEGMLVSVVAVAVDESRDRLFVADNRTPSVKAFDLNGSFLMQIGRSGEGPGEYLQPTGLAYDDEQDGLLVRDLSRSRILFFDSSGRYLKQMETVHANFLPERFFLLKSHWAYVDNAVSMSRESRKVAFVGLNLETEESDTLDVTPWEDLGEFLKSGSSPLPFGPGLVRSLGSDGQLIKGNNSDYRFTIRQADGNSITVQMEWTPVSLADKEWEWWDRRTEAMLGSDAAQWRRQGPPIPRIKPAFISFYVGEDNRIWVLRLGEGIRIPGCARGFEDTRALRLLPCWTNEWLLDVFEGDGTYLGRVDIPRDYAFIEIGWAKGDDVVIMGQTFEGLDLVLVASITI
jgi:hypothetical protein